MASHQADKAGVGPAGRWWQRKAKLPAQPVSDLPGDTVVRAWTPQARPVARQAEEPAHKSKPLFRSNSESYSRSDKILFASGIALSLVCAFFPWYVFLNQDQFGIRAVQLGDIPSSGPAPAGATPAGRIDAPLQAEDSTAQASLDIMTTATSQTEEERDKASTNRDDNQPFPQPEPSFNLVHVVNGRAMMEDDGGLFVVQRGSMLPDSSRVKTIEQRDGRWVVVTSNGHVLELTR